ncbi:cytochrome c oxidase assembly protein [Auraticoccus sp. F435]|uniref:Cytochrome c oxidase assembly protein n=1 Tax=Auraticoccus cholistanensis TaxID=2656650 RepID=A0A6A9UVC0_9ACTN|nr:cytochrome c oxidase assembly protein [Auraticoccus cholistanensis]MVA76906.1 cytochrome c oxidase assembly protein [Auraticoccus cholistanensis]
MRSTRARALAPWLVGLVATTAGVWAAITWQYAQPPLRGHEASDPATSLVAALLRLLATFAGLATLASLAGVVLTARRGTGRRAQLGEPALDRMATARHRAVGWAAASLALVPFDAADTSGLAVTVALPNLRDFLLSTQTTQAWLLTAVVAFVLSCVVPFVRTWPTAVLLLVVGVLVQLPTVVTAQVSVGAGHDLATDAAVVMTLAVAAWSASALALPRRPDADVLRRHHRLAGLALLVALPSRVLIGVFEMAGESWLAPGYGASVLVAVGLLVLLALGWLLRSRLLVSSRPVPAVRLVTVEAVLLVLLAGVSVVQSQLVPPRFRVPQTSQQNFLGYEVPAPPSWESLLLPGRVNLLLLLLAVAMVGLYLLGVRRLHRRGDTWPRGRTAAWLGGWAMVAYVSVSQVWQYASTTFSWHMVLHMALNMGAPALLVLAGPITLLLRARASARRGQLLSLRDAVTAGLGARALHVLGHPILIWALFVGSFYLLYLTGLFDVVMKYHWSHQLMNIHFLLVGALYYQVAIGVDSPGRPIPHVAKLGYILAAMPFHAFFAVAVLNSAEIGAGYYTGLDLTWAPDLAADQQVGGQLAWGLGELPLIGVTIALLAQWFGSEERAARRFDRATSAGHDTSLDAYNEMLAELARRERAQPDGKRPDGERVDGEQPVARSGGSGGEAAR